MPAQSCPTPPCQLWNAGTPSPLHPCQHGMGWERVLGKGVGGRGGERERDRCVYLSDALEEDRLVTRTGRVGKRAHGLRRLVLVRGQELVQALVAQLVEEPLAAPRPSALSLPSSTASKLSPSTRYQTTPSPPFSVSARLRSWGWGTSERGKGRTRKIL